LQVPAPVHCASLQSVGVVSVHATPIAAWLKLQAPAPLQVSGPEHSTEVAVQAGPATPAGLATQAPAVHWSHTPSPQAVPLARVLQTPFTVAPVTTLHAWQSVTPSPPPHALSQQTPSTQLLDMQLLATVQAAPFSPDGAIRVTNTSIPPAYVVSKPPVVGKSVDSVSPVT
jgi:hypothetical protein